MNEEARRLLLKADQAIRASEILVREQQPDFAAGRAYYAMFYVAEALLSEQRLQFSKHSGVHAAYGLHFARTGRLDPKFHRWLLDAFDKRVMGDYGSAPAVSSEQAQVIIRQAQEFLEVARGFLATPPASSPPG